VVPAALEQLAEVALGVEALGDEVTARASACRHLVVEPEKWSRPRSSRCDRPTAAQG
jgi:hypothetical protein